MKRVEFLYLLRHRVMKTKHLVSVIMKTRVFILCLVSIFAFSFCDDDELTLIKTAYTGNEIRLGGCYYGVNMTDSNYATYMFFYQNGVMFSFRDVSELTSLNQFMYLDEKRKEKTMWSVFSVNDSVITTQGWDQPWGHGRPLVTHYGKIMNDSTIQWYKLENTRTGTFEYNSEVYFRYFSPKPDSTNFFIE